MNKIRYYVIGGWYESRCYGGTKTLLGAKRLASKNAEYIDNLLGWQTPSIYRAEDTIVVESRGRITSSDGESIRVAKEFAIPVC